MFDPRAEIEAILSLDPDSYFEEVDEAVGDAPHADKLRLLALCERAMDSPSVVILESNRVPCARVLAALLPLSCQAIESLLAREDQLAYEIHFTLFCCLDFVPLSERLKPSAPFVLSTLSSYLINVSTNEAMNAWKAGESLGNDWPDASENLEVLLAALRSARFTAGKIAALDGITYLLRRDDLQANVELRDRLLDSIKKTACSAAEPDVRRYAQRVLANPDNS